MYKPVDKLYQILDQVGAGGYGKVYKARSLDRNAAFPLVALKMIRVEVEHEGFPLTAIREVTLLRSLNATNHFVKLLDIVTSESSVYLVFEYLPWDLTAIILHPQTALSPQHIRCMMRQILEALCILHQQANIVHRDIKGSNFLLDHDGTVKLGDFGLARRMGQHDFQPMELNQHLTNRVITIWYRPPELLLGSTCYGYEIDIWGVGCVLGELFAKKPPFCGSCEISQLECIFESLGPPPSPLLRLPLVSMLKFSTTDDCGGISSHELASKTLLPYKQVMPELAWDLFLRMLELDPTKRITAAQALNHPYFHTASSLECDKSELTKLVPGEWHEWEVKNLQKRRNA